MHFHQPTAGRYVGRVAKHSTIVRCQKTVERKTRPAAGIPIRPTLGIGKSD